MKKMMWIPSQGSLYPSWRASKSPFESYQSWTVLSRQEFSLLPLSSLCTVHLWWLDVQNTCLYIPRSENARSLCGSLSLPFRTDWHIAFLFPVLEDSWLHCSLFTDCGNSHLLLLWQMCDLGSSELWEFTSLTTWTNVRVRLSSELPYLISQTVQGFQSLSIPSL